MDSGNFKAVGFWILNGLMLWGFSKICIEWNLPYWFLFAVAFVIITWLIIWLMWELGTEATGYFSIFTLIRRLLGISFVTGFCAIFGGFRALIMIPVGIWVIFYLRRKEEEENYEENQ